MSQYHSKWKQYLQMLQTNTKTIAERNSRKQELMLLSEGRKQDAKQKYPIADQFEVVDLLAIQLRAQFGERGVSRYIMFAAKCMENFFETFTTKEDGKFKLKPGTLWGTFFEQVMGIVVEFHRVSQRLEQKDINKYDFDTLYQTLEDLPESPGERRRRLKDKKKALQNSEVIYNDMGIFAVRPLTTQASCYFGENPRLTSWCISTKSKRNYFEKFTQQDGKAFVMTKFSGIPEGDPRHFITLEFNYSGDLIAFHNADNVEKEILELEGIIEDHLEGMLEQNPGFERIQFEPSELLAAIKQSSKEWISNNPPPSPVEAAENRCRNAERLADQEYEFVNVHWQIDEDSDDSHLPNLDSKVVVTFYADLEVLIDIDKPEYEINNANHFLTQGYEYYRSLEAKISKILKYRGRPWSDMADTIHCYDEDGYIKLEAKFDGYDSYHPETADGFESFVAEDCRAINNRGIQLQELLQQILDNEVSGATAESDEDENIFEEVNKYFRKNVMTKNNFYDSIKEQLNIKEEKGRSRQRGIYKFYCMIAYGLTTDSDRSRGLDDILADMRALPNVTIVTVAIRNQKVAEGRYIAGLAIKFIPSTPGDMNTPENVKARIVRDIKRLGNVHSLFKLSTGLIRLE